MRSLVAAAVSLACLAGPVAAQEAGAESADLAHRNQLALFLGGTDYEDRVAFTVGLDYERRLGERFGVGVLADWALGGEGREFVLAPAVFYRPLPRLRLDVATGIERNTVEKEVAFLLRLGVDYDFELNERWSVAPNLNVDLVEGETVFVFGAELGYRF